MIDFDRPDFTFHPASAARVRLDPRPSRMLEKPVVSIVTPFHNTNEVLDETADCVFQQSLQQWEWIIVNDASSDAECLRVLDRYRELDPRIRVVDLESNRGPGGARNEGHRLARADLVFHLDDDDLIEPTTLEKLAWYLETHPHHDLVCGWSVAFGGSEYIWLRGFEPNNDILKSNIVTGRAMMRRDAFQAVGGFDESILGGFEDWDLWLRFANAGRWGGVVRETLDWYRRREDHGDRWNNWDGAEKEKAFRAERKAKYPELFQHGIPLVAPHRDEGQPYAGIQTETAFENPLEKNSKRIMLILPWLAMGGSDKFNLDLIKQLQACGWEITIVTTLEGNLEWMSEFAKVTPDIFPMFSFLPRMDYPRFLDSLIESRNPDVVLCSHSDLAYLLLPYLRSRHPDTVYVDYNHIEELNWKNGGYPRMGVGMQAMLDLNIVSSEHLRGWMIDRGASPGQVEVCYTNVDPIPELSGDKQQMLRKKLEIPDGVPVLLFAGRLHGQKQPEVIAGVARELVRRGKDFVLVIAGDGPESSAINDLAADRKAGRSIRWLGRIPNSEVEELLGIADIFFLPSLWEGIALSVYEAMAAGVCVVGARVGGQGELVTADCGVLIEPSNPKTETAEYVDHIDSLLSDRKGLADKGRRARERVVERFTLKDMGQRMIELFDLATKRHAASTSDSSTQLPDAFARETAVQALELTRVTRVADELWGQMNAGGATSNAAHAAVALSFADQHALRELEFLEGSGLWRTLTMFSSVPSKAVTGAMPADWESGYSDRLERIRKTRPYRLFHSIRENGLYKKYSKLRHGVQD